MKINGSDEVIKLFLEIKVDEGGKNQETSDNTEKITQKVEEIIIRKDEFIIRDDRSNAKAEVQFTKSLKESPEMYLQRISAEVISQRENENINSKKRAQTNDLSGNEIIEIVTKSGLLKGVILSKDGNSNEPSADNDRKWIFRLISVFLVVILIYFIFKQ
ncbi:hypothetical protein [Proteiniclasticum sp.]|uniref:hypothetical protein n=1 Tax=Proteiniclasticum sp. TaxID=2053595 RepID=UPI00289EEE51|nr:hypothetical protein [Proteiniclasticum sp.]